MRKALGFIFVSLLLCCPLMAQVSYNPNLTNIVQVVYNASKASVVVSSNLQAYVTTTVSGGNVSIVQSNTVSASTCGEIIYQLSGTSTSGSFYMEGAYKATIELHGLSLTNPSGPAINIQNGKRIEMRPINGTVSTIKDGGSTDVDAWKAAIYCKGHLEFKDRGTLNVYGNYAHAIYSKEYMSIKNCTINVHLAVKDALHCREYFLMESGYVSLKGFASDGIECNIDGTASTGETANHDNEDSGNIYIMGGTLLIDMGKSAGDSIKADGKQIVSEDAVVNVLDHTTALESIFATQQTIQVYSLLGTYVGKFESPESIMTLPKGTYIIRTSNMTKKINVL